MHAWQLPRFYPQTARIEKCRCAGRLPDAHALRLAGNTAHAEAGALFGPCAASELYGDEVKQRFSGGRLHGVVSSEADQGDA